MAADEGLRVDLELFARIAMRDAVSGRRLHAGDFHRAEPDSDHGVLASDTGAEVVLVVSAPDCQ
jgi:hypothetical protein